jgi:kumamolisin
LTVTVGSTVAVGSYSVTVTGTEGSAVHSVSVTVTVTSSGGGSQLIVNGGFENGQSPWQETSSGGFQIIDPTNPHTGAESAYLCGYNRCTDRIWQSVALPSTFTHITLTFWWFMNTQESGSTCFDFFKVIVRTSSGATIATPFSKCNANANNGWQQVTLDLTSTLQGRGGQTVQILFQGTTDSSLITNIFVDDVTLNVS